jgi:cell wall-associated NlpC family hydrolase
VVNRQAGRYSRQFSLMRKEVGLLAVQAYEQGSANSSAALLTSENPQQILSRSSILIQLSSAHKAQIDRFLAAARQLTSARAAARRTEAGIAQLKGSLTKRKAALNKLIATEKVLLASLTPTQRKGTGPGGGTTGGGGTPQPPPPGSGSGAAAKAVAFVYAQLGKPYVWGASGPSSYDCSGLMMAAWASAGVSIPRVSYAQISSLPAVSLSDLQPGDIIGLAGNSHVAMYVGGGYIIDAPHSGAVVEKVKLAGWYQSEMDAAVRP